ncbi:MAG: hypothetical protein N2517_03830 [Ignavibacteria bacterium]|nr:hypothetical protein [Ignavibacteria bacterium]
MKIAILQLGTFGDMILSTPIFSALKSQFRDIEITLIAGRRNHIVVAYNPHIDQILIWDKFPTKLLKVILALKRTKFDFYIDPKDHFSKQSRIIAKIVVAEKKIGLNPENSKIFDISLPNENFNKHLHFTQRIFQAFEPIGFKNTYSEIPIPELFVSEQSRAYVENYLRNQSLDKEGYLVLNISAGYVSRTFSFESLVEIFRSLHFKIPVVLSFHPKDRKVALNLGERFKKIKIFWSRSILDTIKLVEHSRCVITPDTSIVHIATAFLKPTLAFYNGLDESFNKFHPNNPNAVIIRAKPGDNGIQSITLNKILDAIDEFISNI